MKKLLILLFILVAAVPAFAVTRFYLPSAGTSDITPTFETGAGNWTDITATTPGHLRCMIQKTFTGSATKTTTANTLGRFLCNQYVSDPIGAQTISGNVSGEVTGTKSGVPANIAFSDIVIKVVSNNGSTVRGYLLNMARGNTAYANGNQGRWTPTPEAVQSVTAQNGDRIVIEVGVTVESTGSGRTISLNFLDNSATDLTEGDTAADNSWVEFSQDIIFSKSRIIDE